MGIDLGAVGTYVKAHPKAAMVAGVAGGGAVILGMVHKSKAKDSGEDADKSSVAVSPMESVPIGAPADYSNYPIIYNQIPAPRIPEEAQEPGRQFRSIVRDGRTIKVTAGPDSICPPGYVSAQQPGQPPRCTLVNDANKKPGQRTSYVPSLGQSATYK